MGLADSWVGQFLLGVELPKLVYLVGTAPNLVRVLPAGICGAGVPYARLARHILCGVGDVWAFFCAPGVAGFPELSGRLAFYQQNRLA